MSSAALQTLATRSQPVGNSSPASLLLRRKCACGSPTSSLTGECPECKGRKRLQTKLSMGASNDPLEREADQVADQITGNALPASASMTTLPAGRLQRQEAAKEKTNQEKYQEGLEKLGEAFLKTPLGKELLEKIKQDALVKGATGLGKDFVSTWPGKIVTGAAATGAVAALAATHKELPAQIPEIPLDILTPGLSVQLTYKGPVDQPTEAMITFKFTEQAAKGGTGRKPLSETDKFRAETARLAAENARFQAGMTYQPGSPEDLQQKAEQEAIRRAMLKFSGGPDIEATIKKYPWLATPQPKGGLQLTMPKPSFGIQSPSLLGEDFKLKLPGEQKKKQDDPVLQKKLSIGASNDPLEQEADRVADQVIAAPLDSAVGGAPLHIQRYTGQATDQDGDAAPSSVDRVLAGSGQPLETVLRRDMEQRFGHDFSRVRVHSGMAAEQSAREIDAHAYTVGHHMVFAAGQFAPETQAGRRLLAHELTHVVQQLGSLPLPAARTFAATRPAGGAGRAAVSGLSAAGLAGSTIFRKLKVDQPTVPIDNPTGKGLVQTNAQTVENYLQTLCSGGSVSADKTAGHVRLGASFCPKPMPPGVSGPVAAAPSDQSREPTGCNCLCDIVGSANDFTIVVDDKDWPHTSGRVVTAPSPNSPKLWGTATVSGKAMHIDPWLVLGHELCGHAWLAEKGLPDENATRGEGGHQETVARENELRKEHGIEARGSFKDPFCGESFSQEKAGPGPVEWSSYLKKCAAWRTKKYRGKYKISDKIP